MTNNEIEAVRTELSCDCGKSDPKFCIYCASLAAIDHLLARAEQAERERDEVIGTLRWAHDTLYEINPSNYDHDEVCKLNDASVEVILGIAPLLGEEHGKTDAWWHSRIEGQRAQLAAANERVKELERERDEWEVAARKERQFWKEERNQLAARDAAIAESLRRAELELVNRTGTLAADVADYITEPLRQFQQPEPDKPCGFDDLGRAYQAAVEAEGVFVPQEWKDAANEAAERVTAAMTTQPEPDKLVEAYRTGQLVPVPSVERVVNLQDAAVALIAGLQDEEIETRVWSQFNQMLNALAAMKEGRDGE